MTRRLRSRLLWPLALAAAAGCAEPDLSQPLTGVMIRERLAGRLLVVSELGRDYRLRLEPNGVAVSSGSVAEFGQWRATEGRGLCLKWHDQAEACAPVYQTGAAHYRAGQMQVSVLGQL